MGSAVAGFHYDALANEWRLRGKGGEIKARFGDDGIAKFTMANRASHRAVHEAHTAADTLTRDESGSIHTNYGATQALEITLPQDALAGDWFLFIVMDTDQLQVSPGAAGAYYTAGAKQTDDKYLWADAIGESIMVVCVGGNDWATLFKQGTWTIEG